MDTQSLMWTAWRVQRLSPSFHADDTAPGGGGDDVSAGDRHCYAHPMCILPSGALGLEQDLSGHRPRSAWACVTVRLHGGRAREDVRRSAQPLFAGCDPGWCFRGLPVRRAFTRNSALREAATGVRGRSGQPRPHMGHLLSSCDDQLIRQSPAVSKRRPGLSPSPSWQLRTRTTSHPVGAHGSRTTIPLPAGRAQEGETSLMSGFSSHERNRFARLDPSGPDQGPAE
jgi:hypothetical protein